MEDNKLIAEFMGYKLTKCSRGQAWERPTLSSIHDNYKLHGRLWVENDSYYKWDTSWDWLMPVVEKIEEIAIDDDNLTIKEHRYQVDMSYTQCSIYDHVRDGVIASADMGTKLLSTHRAVVEFIKEYNDER